jgi:hypothetical protein
MYIRRTTRSYKGTTYTNHLLVESVHTAKGPRQRTICSLGDLSPRPREEWLELARKIEHALVGQPDLLEPDDAEVVDIVHRVRARQARPPPSRPPTRSAQAGAAISVDPARVSTERHREAGPVHVGYQFWRRLGLDDVLRDCGLPETVRRLACVMTLNRLIAPASEHAMPAWIRRTALADMLAADFDDTDGFTVVHRQPSPRNPAQKKSRVEVQTRTDDQYTWVLCRSEQRIAKDRAIRTKQEQRLRADLDKLAQRIAGRRLVKPDKINQAIGRLKERYPRVARYFHLAHDPKAAALVADFRPDRHAKAEQLDGCYLLKTDRHDLSGDALWRIYALLTRAEDAFRDMKSPLGERPIFHRAPHRVDCHIFLCLLAYHLLAAIEQTLLDQHIHTSWATVRDTLKTHHICTVVLPTDRGPCLRIRKAATPEPDVLDIYRRLNLPTRIIDPIHSWSDAPNSD